MSIVIAINRENFSMIATDSRITLFDQSEKQFEDNERKLHLYGTIWLAGVGYGPLVCNFRTTLEDRQITDDDRFEPLFKEAHEYTLRNNVNVLDRKQLMSCIYTVILYSYATIEGGALKIKIGRLEINNMHKSVTPNKVITLPPENPDTISHLKTKYEPLIESNSSLDDTVANTARFIKDVSAINQTVSDICDFGLLIIDDQGKLLVVNIRESADNIIKAHASDTLKDHWKIIWTIESSS